MTGVSEIGAIRQAIITGRVFETMTLRGLTVSKIALEIDRAGVRKSVPALLGRRDGGYFVLSLSGGFGMPEPPAAEVLSLCLTVDLADGRRKSMTRTITGADLARVQRAVAIDGISNAGPVIAGAPFAMDVSFDPRPVTLNGTLVFDHDPAQPIVGATVSIGALTTQTNAAGRFRLTPLPLASPLTITVDQAGTETDFTFHPDFTLAANSTALSINL